MRSKPKFDLRAARTLTDVGYKSFIGDRAAPSRCTQINTFYPTIYFEYKNGVFRSRLSDSFLSRFEGLDHAEGASIGFMVASGVDLYEGYGHGGPGVCLGDGQTEAEGVPSRCFGVCTLT